jgi:hypothetical protein
MAIQVTGLLHLENGSILQNPKITLAPMLGYKGELRFFASVCKDELELFHIYKDYDKSFLTNDGESNIYDQMILQGEQVIIDFLNENPANNDNIYTIV